LAMVGAGVLVALLCVSLFCLAIYDIIRGIGWVISGFAAS